MSYTKETSSSLDTKSNTLKSINMKLVLVGKAAAGKDHLRKRLMDQGLKFGVSCTTRPPRPGEEHGKDYYFLSDFEFLNLIEANLLIEYQKFNGWYYGMTYVEFNDCDVMILNREAVDLLPAEIRSQCVVLFLDIEQEIRRQRMEERNDTADSLDRRIQADEEQYKDFKNFDIRVTNHDF